MYCIHSKNMCNTYIKIWPSFSAFYLNWITTICSQFHQFIYPKRKVKVSSSVTLWDPMDCSPPGSSSMEFSRQEYWSGLPFPSPGDLPNPGIESQSPSLQADSTLFEPSGKHKHHSFYLSPMYRVYHWTLLIHDQKIKALIHVCPN